MTVEITRGLVKLSFGYMHYRSAGDGPPIIIINAAGQASSLSIELMQALAPRMRAIAIDSPGHGMSDPVPQPSIRDYAAWVLELMDALGLPQAAILAEATANAVALELAHLHPDRVSQLIMVNCPFHADADSSARAQAPLRNRVRPTDPTGFPLARTIDFLLTNDAVHAPMHPTQSWMDRINVTQAEAGREWMQMLTAFAAFDFVSALRRCRTPTLLLMAEHFQYVKRIPDFEQLVQGLTCRVVPGGRFCVAWERADLVGEWAADFCLA